jgi:plasmid stabilization system protein ParE
MGGESRCEETDAPLMELRWAPAARSDLERLHQFLEPFDAKAAAQVIRRIVAMGDNLVEQPRLGERLEEFDPREVRRIIVGRYELRYELTPEALFILRIWHTREER